MPAVDCTTVSHLSAIGGWPIQSFLQAASEAVPSLLNRLKPLRPTGQPHLPLARRDEREHEQIRDVRTPMAAPKQRGACAVKSLAVFRDCEIAARHVARLEGLFIAYLNDRMPLFTPKY